MKPKFNKQLTLGYKGRLSEDAKDLYMILGLGWSSHTQSLVGIVIESK